MLRQHILNCMLKFYLIIGIELLFSPFLYGFEALKKWLGRFRVEGEATVRSNTREIDPEVIFAIHEWAGYPFVRQKTIKYTGTTFTCGLKPHLDRLSVYKGKYKLKKILTLSNANNQYAANFKRQDFYPHDLQICPVDNVAMDFSGYNYVAKNMLDPKREQVVFLTNTSVDATMVDFIDQYTDLFRKWPELGLLGISYSTKIYQTFIKNNFRPHLQSFFLATRSSVLQELLEKNGGNIPGATEDYKLAIIRFGEVRITEMIQQLGYKAAVITADGKLTFLPDFGIFYNGYHQWELPMDDYRLSAKHPNRINTLSIKKGNLHA